MYGMKANEPNYSHKKEILSKQAWLISQTAADELFMMHIFSV